MTTATVSTKGRLTIPSELRKKYGLKSGDRISFELAGCAIKMQPVTKDAK